VTRRIAVLVAWPYANGPLHIGHVGGAILPPDIFARYHRLRGNDVVMVSGSDTHGTPVTLRAEVEGRSPEEVFREFHAGFLETFQQLGITFDLFTHTHTANHHRVASELFLALLEAEALILGKAGQLYDPARRRYLPDRFVEGTCPYCGFPNARGDQCDNCGRLLDATELIAPRARGGDGTALETHEREHYFLDLPRFAGPLEEWLTRQDDWRISVRNGALGQIRDGLKPRPITRDLDWGVPVPLPGWERRVMYVWFEAVIGYLSGSIELAALQGRPDDWRRQWFAPDGETYYFIGKDNTPFHAVIWPAMLLGAGDYRAAQPGERLHLPTDVVANEFVNMEGGVQMSKSRDAAVWLPDYLASYAPDPLRYYLTITAPESRDTEFSWPDFVRRNNDELLATWGNLVNRVLRFTFSRLEGRVPEPGPLEAPDEAILQRAAGAFAAVGAEIEARHFKAGLVEAMAVAHEVNRYLNDRAPWKSIESDPRAAATAVYVALQAIDHLHVVLAPFLPHMSEAVHRYLGYARPLSGSVAIDDVGADGQPHPVARYVAGDAAGTWAPGMLEPGRVLRDPEPLVAKLDEAEVTARERARYAPA
jgi:methionyl-tRNA synthetase